MAAAAHVGVVGGKHVSACAMTAGAAIDVWQPAGLGSGPVLGHRTPGAERRTAAVNHSRSAPCYPTRDRAVQRSCVPSVLLSGDAPQSSMSAADLSGIFGASARAGTFAGPMSRRLHWKIGLVRRNIPEARQKRSGCGKPGLGRRLTARKCL
jgi:hypothetical protein